MKKSLISALVALVLFPSLSYAQSVWDGSVDTEWEQDANGNYLIQSAAELAGLAQVVNEKDLSCQANTEHHAKYGAGMTFILTTDIDLNNLAWNPIGWLAKDNVTNTNRVKRLFCGTFDGGGHVVSNVNVSLNNAGGGYGTAKKVTAGLFGAINAATIRNLTVANSTFYLESNCYENYGGAIVGWMENGSQLINCASINNSITVNSPWKLGVKYGKARAGGVSGSAEDSSLTDCVAAGNTISAEGAKSESTDGISNSYDNSATLTDNGVYGSVEEMAADVANITRKNEKAIRENVVNNANPPYYLWSEETGMLTDIAVFSLNTTPEIIGGGVIGVYSPNAVERTIDGVTYTTITNLDTIQISGYEYAAPTREQNGYQLYYYKCFYGGVEAIHCNASGMLDFNHSYTGATGNVTVQAVYVPNYLVEVETNGVSDAFVYGESSYVARENELISITLLTDTIYDSNEDYRYYTIKSITLNEMDVLDLVIPGNISVLEFAMPASSVVVSVEFEENVYSGIGAVEVNDMRVYGVEGGMVAVVNKPTPLTVVSIDGRVVYQATIDGEMRIELPAGIYIANGNKVVVR